jgi:hypothetical protein
VVNLVSEAPVIEITETGAGGVTIITTITLFTVLSLVAGTLRCPILCSFAHSWDGQSTAYASKSRMCNIVEKLYCREVVKQSKARKALVWS